MLFPRCSFRAMCGTLVAAVLFAACSGQNVTPNAPGATSGGAQTLGTRPTSVPPTSPAPTATPSSNLNGPYCGGHDRDDCHAFRFILPLQAKVVGGALNLSVPRHGDDDDGGLPCLIYRPEHRFQFTVENGTDATVGAITQPDYCAFFEDIGIDGAKRQGVIPLPLPSPMPSAAPSPTPTAAATATPEPGHLYIVEVAIACKSGDEDGWHHHGARHGDDDEHDCDAGPKNTLIGAIAGPGVRDGSGHITFAPIANGLHFAKGTRYWFFLAKYRDDDPNVPHF